VRIGALGLFMPALLKPEAARWRLALWATARGLAAAPAPPRGRVLSDLGAEAPAGWIEAAGYWRAGPVAIRFDLAEQVARALHAQRTGRDPFTPEPRIRDRLGLTPELFAPVLRALGYRAAPAGGVDAVAWSGAGPERRDPPARATPHSPFKVLSTIAGGAA
jgi:ATP-dependent RNA helicase SUPV3L1/SUV3